MLRLTHFHNLDFRLVWMSRGPNHGRVACPEFRQSRWLESFMRVDVIRRGFADG